MKPGDGAGRQGRGDGQAQPLVHLRQQGDRAEQDEGARHGHGDAWRVPGQDRSGQAHGVHAYEVHGRDTGRHHGGGGQSRAAAPAAFGRPGQVQLHGDPEGGRDDHQRQEGLQRVVADIRSGVVGQHGDEVGDPDAQSAHQRRRQGVGSARSRRQVARAFGQKQGDADAEDAGQQGEGGDPPIVALDQAAQDAPHHDAPPAS